MRIPFLLLFAVAATAFTAGRISAPTAPSDEPRVTGIGGVFFKSKDPKALRAWYEKHLGMPMNEYGAVFEYGDADADGRGFLQWSAFGARTKYFAPSPKEFMINYRVVHLDELVKNMRAAGVVFTDSIERVEYGAFVHALDPDSNKLELWEPVDSVYARMGGNTIK
jgi:predicted enzyme related to lactoylglutathione lyase